MIKNEFRNENGSYKLVAWELDKEVAKLTKKLLKKYKNKLSYDAISFIARNSINCTITMELAIEVSDK